MPNPLQNWNLPGSEPEKRRLIEAKWPGILRGNPRPMHQHWWYLLPFTDERTQADMRAVASACFPQSLTRFREIEGRVHREAHYEYENRDRCFLVIEDPDIASLGLALRGKYCPLYAVVVGESRVGVDEAPPDDRPDYLNFYKLGQPIARLTVHLGKGGLEVSPGAHGGTIVAPSESDGGPSSYTRLGDMRSDHREAPLSRIATADVAPLTTGDPASERASEAPPESFTWTERLVMLGAVLVTLGLMGMCGLYVLFYN